MEAIKFFNKKMSTVLISAAICGPVMMQSVQAVEPTDLIQPKIVGGGLANTSEWQFYTQILNSNTTTAFCGGSYIGDGYVLTAAHCVKNKPAIFLHVEVAGFTLNGGVGDRIQVAEKFVHPLFNTSTLNHDVALLKLEREPTVGQPVSLAQGSVEQYARTGDLITVAGLGRLSENGGRAGQLEEVDVPLVSDAVCNQSGGSYANVGDVAFCAGYPQGQKDSCSGDSGGPIVVDTGGQRVQLGIVSWGVGCARPGKYGVYADVAALRDWIDGIKAGEKPLSLSYLANQQLNDFALGAVVNHTFRIRNSGDSDVSINSLNLSASGVATSPVTTSDTCNSATLAANQSCEVGVEFGASQAGVAKVALNFKVDQSDLTYTANVSAKAIDEDVVIPDTGITPFVAGKTKPVNGQIYSYAGQCFKAKNTPGVWETPKAGSWFWSVTACATTPTVEPTIEPTVEPTMEPTVEPTVAPTIAPTIAPTVEPTQPPQGVIEFVLGQTKVNNGDIISYQGECFAAKNNPGTWEPPKAGSWFWTAVTCP
ncbi:trypsin-like serine protease [Motilimonas sp. 1_MG-2023]|uniref:trypsin-like serine protease n=1 Tax=Motilimonas sp. 1_MG-2023 TaxID=3062672 RepID=UPI0026E297E2|nr:trypsin-like serine protease [Motilimonas sp. 1_MG-2023]MDO6526697.1 trypsin-like serine protease [Motilimonas sp. 1_MG-2023]